MHKKATKHSSHVLIVGHSNDDNVSPLCWTLVLFLLHCSFRVYPFFLACHLVFVQPLFFFPLASLKGWGLVVHSDSRLTNNVSSLLSFLFRHIHNPARSLLFPTSSHYTSTLVVQLKNERLDSIPPNGAVDFIQ